MVTDLGVVTEAVLAGVAGADLLVVESNHDVDWVKSGPYPYSLKRRILGDHGHLSNEDGAELAAMGVQSGASVIVLAHLSAENNTPARALETVSRRLRAMGCDPEEDITLAVAPRKEVGPTYRLERRLAQIDQELSGQEQPRNQEEVMTKARELLELKTLPRELAVMLIEKIEIGEQDPDTGQQEVKIHWKF